MYKTDFLEFYNNVVKELGVRFETEYKQFHFCDNPNSLYEEYLNQKTILRVLYEKNDGEEKALLDRHKVCACMLTAIIKVRLVSGDIESDDSFTLSMASRINEQLAFMSAWELFLGFLRLHKKATLQHENYELPDTYHNEYLYEIIIFGKSIKCIIDTADCKCILFVGEVFGSERRE